MQYEKPQIVKLGSVALIKGGVGTGNDSMAETWDRE